MTQEEYLSPVKFPLTTRRGLSLDKQQMIDAINLRDLQEMEHHGKPVNAEQKQAYAELLEKKQFQG